MARQFLSSNSKFLIFLLVLGALCYLGAPFLPRILDMIFYWAFSPYEIGSLAVIDIPFFTIVFTALDYNFRKKFYFAFVMQSFIKSLMVFTVWAFLVSLASLSSFYLPVFLLIAFFLLRRFNQSADWSSNQGYSFEAPNLSITYDSNDKTVKIKTNVFCSEKPLPGGYEFGIYTHQKWVDTHATGTTTSGERLSVRTGGFLTDSHKTTLRISEFHGTHEPSHFSHLYYECREEPDTFNTPNAYQLTINTRSISTLKRFLDMINDQWCRQYSETQKALAATKAEEREKERIADEQRRTEQEALKKQQKVAALQAVKTQCTNLLNDWGIDLEGAFKTYRYRDEDGGYICIMLAADKEGRGGAILNDGKDTWSGSWKNAQISEVGDTLEIQIDDPEYRKQNLKERRFVIKYFDREQRVEWIDRIRILSAQA